MFTWCGGRHNVATLPSRVSRRWAAGVVPSAQHIPSALSIPARHRARPQSPSPSAKFTRQPPSALLLLGLLLRLLPDARQLSSVHARCASYTPTPSTLRHGRKLTWPASAFAACPWQRAATAPSTFGAAPFRGKTTPALPCSPSGKLDVDVQGLPHLFELRVVHRDATVAANLGRSWRLDQRAQKPRPSLTLALCCCVWHLDLTVGACPWLPARSRRLSRRVSAASPLFLPGWLNQDLIWSGPRSTSATSCGSAGWG